MRKNVLFIARFDNILKGMNKILAKSFNMQICPPEPAMVEKMLDITEIDLILFYISKLPATLLTSICIKLDNGIQQKTPIIVFGSSEECMDFYKYGSITVSKYMYRPLSAHDIAKTIYKLLEMEPETPIETQPETQPEKPPEKPPEKSRKAQPETPPEAPQPEIKKNMSLAELANSLEADERHSILLVDDDGRILRAIKMLLEKTYRISLANSAVSALESIERERPDVVLLDYEMPGINGKQTLEMIRRNKRTQDLPVFFLTGVSDKERIKDVIHLRPQGYLLKSSEQSKILGALEKFFNGSNE